MNITETTTLQEILEDINSKGGELIAVGAKSAYIYIGDSLKAEEPLKKYLNRHLRVEKNTKNPGGKFKPLYRQPGGDDALVILIEGDEEGAYWTLSEYEGKPQTFSALNMSDAAALAFAGAIINEIIRDVVRYQVALFFYLRPQRLEAPKSKLIHTKNLEKAAEQAARAILRKDHPIPGKYSILDNVPNLTAHDIFAIAEKRTREYIEDRYAQLFGAKKKKRRRRTQAG